MIKWLKARLFVLLAVSLLLAGGLPVFAQAPTEITFPELTGPHKVGRISYEWIDQSRRDPYSSNPDLKRDLLVYVWFPASPATRARIVPYMDGELIWNIQFPNDQGLEPLVHPHAYRTNKLDLTEPSYPVLIFAHGYSLHTLNYSSIIEEIASHGYIVIGTTHPFNTSAIRYPDGRLVLGGFVDKATEIDSQSLTNALTVWTQDISFVIDQAETLNSENGIFKGHLDLSRLGVLGHSFGGITAAQVVALDSRVSAGANLDGTMTLVNVNASNKPFLFMDTIEAPGVKHQTKDHYWLSITGSRHLNYGDYGLLYALMPTIENIGVIDPVLGLQIINSYLVTFFDHYLKGADLNWQAFAEAKLTAYE